MFKKLLHDNKSPVGQSLKSDPPELYQSIFRLNFLFLPFVGINYFSAFYGNLVLVSVNSAHFYL